MITARASRNAAMGVAKRSIFSAGDKDKLASAASFKQFTEVALAIYLSIDRVRVLCSLYPLHPTFQLFSLAPAEGDDEGDRC